LSSKGAIPEYPELRCIAQQEEFPPDAFTNSAQISRSFIEQYHEKLEEDYLFPCFRKHNQMVDLVNVLQQQHEAGSRVTEQILTISAGRLKSNDDK
jgi:hemerythrin-like domain-containing protein